MISNYRIYIHPTANAEIQKATNLINETNCIIINFTSILTEYHQRVIENVWYIYIYFIQMFNRILGLVVYILFIIILFLSLVCKAITRPIKEITLSRAWCGFPWDQ